MDLSSPISSVIPSAHGAVLAVLARTDEPLSGRQVAALVRGRFTQPRVNRVLGELAEAGVVLREDRPPAKIYRLNRDHVASAGIEELGSMWLTLVERIRGEISAWHVCAAGAWLFGSAAVGDAGPDSDIDLLLVRSASPNAAEEPQWHQQVDLLSEHVRLWAGNSCEVLELTSEELRKAVDRDDRLVQDLRAHALSLTGPSSQRLLKRR